MPEDTKRPKRKIH